MNPDETDLSAIVREALERPSGDDRAAHLDRACCGDARLRFHLEALLAVRDGANGSPGSATTPPGVDLTGAVPWAVAPAPDREPCMHPAPETGATASVHAPTILEGPGSRIGTDKLLQRIGEGGMGAVFMAEQEKPVRRKVALKVIKPGMDTGQVVARFEAERQALAMMDHPHIARVLDAGATETGRPYFVMELVKGVPITEYCDRNHLSPKERLELFIPICHAIQHAHQKGIIHRDIKPSNVLVTLHDGHPLPKVIDFGVAKAIDQRLTERTMFTEFGTVIGTLEYMSPEQAEMGALDIDTRSDIYSLGVLLYELLTGSTPLGHAELRRAAHSEIIRRIREEEPTRPSTRLSESKDSLPSISARRRMDPGRLTRFVRGDLDWIVMKALEKDRTRRYETANGFARDIRRYLDGDTVEACPPSARYRLCKFARKHRAALATVGAFATLLVAATAISAGFAVRADRERLRAMKAELRAQDRERMAIDAVRRYGEVVRDTPELKNNPRLAGLRAALLKEPRAFFQGLRDRLQADRETTPDSLARLGVVSFDLAQLTDEIGDKQEALRAFEESLAIRERLAAEQPTVASYRRDLAWSHNNIGNLQRATGHPAEALASYERARAIHERLATEHPTVTQHRRDLATSYNNIGLLQRETGHPAEALASHERARALRERLASEDPSDAQFRSDLALSHNFIAGLHGHTGHPVEALASHERARAIRERLAQENPTVAEYQRALASSDQNIGLLQRETGHPAEALASLEQARAIRERLARANPTVTECQRELASSLNGIGLLMREAGRPAEALASYERAHPIFERLARENPTVILFQSDLAASHSTIGNLKRETGHPAEAMASLEQARTIMERLTRENESVTEFQGDLAGSYFNIGHLQQETGHPAEALASYERARAIIERLAREHPTIVEFRRNEAVSHNNIGLVQSVMGHPAEAMASYERGLAIQDRLAREHPESPDFASALGATLNNMAAIDVGQRRFGEAREKLTRAIEWQRRALAANPMHPTYRQFLANQLTNLVRAAEGLGRADEAEAARRELAELEAGGPARAALDARLAAVLKGQAPRDDLERLALADRAQEKALHAASARLYAEALANDPKLGDDRRAQHRYNAACSAALAGCGRGQDQPAPDDAARAGLRQRAREWLRAELAAWAGILDAGTAEAKAAIAAALEHWSADPDLAGIRDDKELARLTEEERLALRRLWKDVETLRTRAAGR